MVLFSLASQRPRPDLLYVIGEQVLAGLSPAERAALDAKAPATRRCLLPPTADTAQKAVDGFVRPTLQDQGIDAVVLLGDYDGVPAQPLETIDPRLTGPLSASQIRKDPDRFQVWSDDRYGDRDGDGWPEVPVSRIPRGVLLPALEATTAPTEARRQCLRDASFLFASGPYQELPPNAGSDGLFDSPTLDSTGLTAAQLQADCLYLPLHGRKLDARTLWGGVGAGGGRLPVIDLNQAPLPQDVGAVVFCGACWGALIVDNTPAFAGPRPTPRTAEDSIALAFLHQGATAFVGFTGYHYVPTKPPYRYAGEPLHRGFWRHLMLGKPPAAALFAAKLDYRAGIPHYMAGGVPEPIPTTTELKTLWSATCLGIGWWW